MNEIIEILCSYFSNDDNTIISRQYADLIELLKKANILQRANPPKEVICDLCEQTHLARIVKLPTGYYTNCDYTGLTKKINKKDLLNYKLNRSALCKWLKIKLALETASTHVSEGDYYHLGSTASGKPNFDIYITFTSDITVAIQTFDSLAKPHKILIWCGEAPHHKKAKKYLISLNRVLIIENESLELNKKPFAELVETVSLKEIAKILLRDDVQLEKEDAKHYLLIGKNTNFDTFNDKHSISPTKYKLLETLHKEGIGLELQDLADVGIAKHKRTVSTKIKELNILCANSNIEPILKKVGKTHWKLNSPLDGERLS